MRALEEYSHRLEGADDSFFHGSDVLESLIQENDLEERDFSWKNWYDDFEAMKVEINSTDAFGAITIHQWSGENGEKLPQSFNTQFSIEEDANELLGDQLPRREVLDVSCIEIQEDALNVSAGVLAPRGQDVSINPEYVFGMVLYGEPPRAEELGEKMQENLHPDHVDYLEDGLPGPSLGRVRGYVEGGTSIVGIGYTPAGADYESLAGDS